MKPKVILYNPKNVFYTMPLSLIAVGSALAAGRYEVILIDGRLESDPVAAAKPYFGEALCVAVTVLTGAPIHDALYFSRAIKQANPDVAVIWGGWHPSLFPEQCLKEPAVDIVVEGQGESALAQLLERIQDQASLDGLPGVIFKEAGAIKRNAPRVLEDMNQLPGHRYDMIDTERYFALKQMRQLDYIASTGCHFRCAFCADPFVFKRRWSGLAPERIGEEIESLWRRHRFNELAFQDETFFTYPARAQAIAEEFLRRGLPIAWTATMRADQGARLSSEAFALLRRSGLRQVLVGVESGSSATLKRIRKDITLDQVFTCARQCARHGIAVNFPFIVGFPEEPPESVQETFAVIKQLRAISPNFDTQIFFYRPYPGSALTQEAGVASETPQTLQGWADFDYVGSRGPWVTRGQWRLVQRFKFYSRFAWRQDPRLSVKLLKQSARWRCRHDFYNLPLEKVFVETLRPKIQLS